MDPQTPVLTETPSPPRKRGVLMAIALLLVAVVAVGVVLLVQGNDDGKPSSSGAKSTTRSTATTTTPAPPRTAEGAAQALFAAWQDANRAAARRVATPDAVAQMFEVRAWRLPGFRFASCVPVRDGSSGCRWLRVKLPDYLTITVTQGDGPPTATAAHFTFGTRVPGAARLTRSPTRVPSGPR